MPYNYYNGYGNQYVPANYAPYMQSQRQEMYQQYNRQPSLLGKIVDNIEVVKAIDIPLDRKYKLFSTCRWFSNCE